MTTVYFVRHGQSVANVEELIAGFYDAPLTAIGEQQARLTANYLKQVPFSVAYASDLKRAYRTGEIVAAPHTLKVLFDEGLRELYAGELEGHPFEEFVDSAVYRTYYDDPENFSFPGGEKMPDFQKRVHQAVMNIVARHPDETILLATHATVIRVLECLWSGLPISELNTVPWVSNASVTVVAVADDGTVQVVERDVHEHLAALHTTLPGVL